MRGKFLYNVVTASTNGVYGVDEFVGREFQNGKWMLQVNFKAVSVAAPYGSGDWRLYDVVDDPAETRHLAKEQPEMLKGLQAASNRYAKRCRRGFVEIVGDLARLGS